MNQNRFVLFRTLHCNKSNNYRPMIVICGMKLQFKIGKGGWRSPRTTVTRPHSQCLKRSVVLWVYTDYWYNTSRIKILHRASFSKHCPISVPSDHGNDVSKTIFGASGKMIPECTSFRIAVVMNMLSIKWWVLVVDQWQQYHQHHPI